MNTVIDAAFSRARVVIIGFIMILIFGVISYNSIPKESMPEVVIPTVYVSTSLEGISPEDSVTSLLRPLETELSAISGLREMQTNGYEGGGSITLEFDAGFDPDQAIVDVQQAVDRAKANLPADASDPLVREINTALFPIMTVVLSGPVPERTLNMIADALADEIEGLPGVLEVDIGGKREDLVEVLIDPVAFETYNLSFTDIATRVAQNNVLVAGGALDSGDGRLVIKLPGLITSAQDVLDLPLKVVDGVVISFSDVAEVRRTFMDPMSYARINGEAAISLEIKKKSGANIIETAAGVRAVLEAAQEGWPGDVRTTITQDESVQVVTLLGDLQNNVLAAIVLVIIVILAFLGPKSAFLVGLSIPGAFLSGVALLWFSGFTMNIVVLFGLILVAGMLVDGSIVVVEYADRRMAEGAAPATAYADAAKRMAWPIIASTATSLAVFLPLLFWQGVVGQFMKFLPITVLLTLSASLLMALVFIPVLGAVISRRTAPGTVVPAAVDEDPRLSRGPKRIYVRALERALLRPWATVVVLFMGLAVVVVAYGKLGAGVEFFPATEPDFAQVQVLSRDNLSIGGQDRLLREVESRLIGHPEIKSIYARSSSGGAGSASEQIGTIQMEFTDWQSRRPADVILSELRTELETIPGLRIALAVQAGGPAGGQPIALEIAGPDPAARSAAIDAIRAEMARIGGITDISDTRPLPGIDYEIRVDRNQAARYGADIALIGQAVRLLTTGVTVSDYRPGDTSDSVDIRVRFPAEYRTLDRVRDLRIPTDQGMIPIGTFVEMAPVDRSGTILRIDSVTVDQMAADVAPGILPNDKIMEIAAFIAATDFPGVEVGMKGEAADQAEAAVFLGTAFLAAIMLMLMILVTQFNSISQAILVLSAIVFSVAGVFIGLMVTGRPFGVVMGGLGIIALAGIVVNNNIVLIDAYIEKRKAGRMPIEAALMAGSERMRPVLLTSLTTVLGLIPMALAMGIDIPGREIVMGAPSTLWWVDLSTAIVGGLSFATILTLIVTPAVLVLIDRSDRLRELGIERKGISARLRALFRRRRPAV